MQTRSIVLDTETTGFRPNEGDRLVEIGCIELINQVPSKQAYFHCYINPERDMPEGAYRVHKLSAEFLSDKPLFKDVADEFLAFIQDSPLIIHNAEFDMGFINAELKRIGKEPIPKSRAIDTVLMARKKFPGASNSLDALCDRFKIDRNKRADAHGAIIDCELLAEVYLELIGGRQQNLSLGAGDANPASKQNGLDLIANIQTGNDNRNRNPAPAYGISTQEAEAHKAMLTKINNPLFKQ